MSCIICIHTHHGRLTSLDGCPYPAFTAAPSVLTLRPCPRCNDLIDEDTHHLTLHLQVLTCVQKLRNENQRKPGTANRDMKLLLILIN